MMLSLFALLVVAAVAVGVFGVGWLIRRNSGDAGEAASGAARRIVLYALLFLLVTITAIGVAGLLRRVLPGVGQDLAGSDITELARSLAFTLIAGPMTGAFWWFLWRRIDQIERASIGWALYLASMTFVSLIIAGIAMLSLITDAIEGDWSEGTLATGMVWAAIWVWHRWMSTRPVQSPTTLTDVAPVGGSTVGLLMWAGGSITLITSLLSGVLESAGDRLGETRPWWETPAQALVWAAGGAGIWWWYWIHDDTRSVKTPISDTMLVLAGIVLPAATTLGGAAVTLYVLMQAVLGPDPFDQVSDPLSGAVAALAIGALVWAYHHPLLGGRILATRRATRLLLSGLGLVVGASGIGVIINAMLEALTQSLVDSDRLGLLLGGISSLTVGAPLWYAAWRPATPPESDEVGSMGRRIYLVAVFGVAALTALITILVIGFQLFEYALDQTPSSLIDDVRAPLGLLVATGLVAAYHYPVWRRDRQTRQEAPARTIDHVILVTGTDADPVKKVIAETTGASVTVWQRADRHDGRPSDEHLVDALAGVAGRRVMVVTGPGARVEVIPLMG